MAVLPVHVGLPGWRRHLPYRGVIITYEAIRQWTLQFGQDYANTLRRRQPKRGDKWHLDEVVLTMNGKHHYLWRAVDQDGYILDILVQPRHDRKGYCQVVESVKQGLLRGTIFGVNGRDKCPQAIRRAHVASCQASNARRRAP